MRSPLLLLLLAVAATAGACSSGSTVKRDLMTREEALDPENCRDCHETQYRQWSGSMHAYAADDPIFIAMNRRGQEETNGQLGDFCLNCHAPMAVREGAIDDPADISDLPQHLKGVTCYFCHNVESVEGTHNNPLKLANDVTMRGSFEDFVESPAHDTAYSAFLDGATPASSSMCGACHDIVLPSPPAPAAVALEETFTEWRQTIFGTETDDGVDLSCNSCHMLNSRGPAATVEGLDTPSRTLRGHEFAAVDTALIPWPEMEAQAEQIQMFLDTTLRVDICVEALPMDRSSIRVTLDNIGAGHAWPSGASQDRRAWVEVRAFRGGNVCYESGVVNEGQPVVSTGDPDLWQIRDYIFGPGGEEVHMFWDVASVVKDTIPGPITNDLSNPDFFRTHVRRQFPEEGVLTACIPDRVTVRVRLRAVGLDVLDDLIGTGHLDDEIRAQMPTFDLIPNRRFSDIPSLETVTFEWSDATRDDLRFDTFFDNTTEPGRRFDCIGMKSNRR